MTVYLLSWNRNLEIPIDSSCCTLVPLPPTHSAVTLPLPPASSHVSPALPSNPLKGPGTCFSSKTLANLLLGGHCRSQVHAVTCQRRRIVPGLAVSQSGAVIGCRYCELGHSTFKVACPSDSHLSSGQSFCPPAASRDVFLCSRWYFFVFLCQGWSVSMPSVPARASGVHKPVNLVLKHCCFNVCGSGPWLVEWRRRCLRWFAWQWLTRWGGVYLLIIHVRLLFTVTVTTPVLESVFFLLRWLIISCIWAQLKHSVLCWYLIGCRLWCVNVICQNVDVLLQIIRNLSGLFDITVELWQKCRQLLIKNKTLLLFSTSHCSFSLLTAALSTFVNWKLQLFSNSLSRSSLLLVYQLPSTRVVRWMYLIVDLFTGLLPEQKLNFYWHASKSWFI